MLMDPKLFWFVILLSLDLEGAARSQRTILQRAITRIPPSLDSIKQVSREHNMNKSGVPNEQIVLLASSLLGVSTSEILTEEITEAFPWARKHHIYWTI